MTRLTTNEIARDGRSLTKRGQSRLERLEERLGTEDLRRKLRAATGIQMLSQPPYVAAILLRQTTPLGAVTARGETIDPTPGGIRPDPTVLKHD